MSSEHTCWNCSVAVSPKDVACSACGELLRISDKYVVQKHLGEGSMGVVYQATDEDLARKVAVKLLHGRQANKPGKRERFLTECRAMAALDHPGIAQIYAADVQGDQFYFVQQLVDGKPFAQFFEDHPSGLPIGEACHIAERLLDALAHAHSHGVTHRDVNPNNVLVVTNRSIYSPILIDFGMARVTGQDSTRTAWGGTPGYAAPEQILDPESNDPRSDIYAVGALLYSLLGGGRVPYHLALYAGIGSEPRALLKAYKDIDNGDVPLESASVRRRDVSTHLNAVIEQALQPNREARYQSAEEMLAALRQALETDAGLDDDPKGEPVDLSKIEESAEHQERLKLGQRSRRHSYSAAGLGVLMAAVGVYLANQRADERNRVAAEARSAALASASAKAVATSIDEAKAAPLYATPFLFPAGIAIDGGKLYVADRGAHRIQMVEEKRVSTIAGSTQEGFADGAAAQASFDAPQDVAVGSKGEIYVADTGNHRIRRIANGTVSTIAGGFEPGLANGAGQKARFNSPAAISVGADGKLYVADTQNHQIRRIDLATETVETFAGQDKAGTVDGPIEKAFLESPSSLAVDKEGAVYFTESKSSRLRVIREGRVETLANIHAKVQHHEHNRPKGRFWAEPYVAVDPKGGVFVTAPQQHLVFALEDDTLTIVAGSPKNPGYKDTYAAKARFRAPQGIAISDSGTVYVMDPQANSLRAIRDGMVLTVVRGRPGGFIDGASETAQFDRPWGIAADAKGLVVADWLNQRIRRIEKGVVRTIAGTGAQGYYDGAASNARFQDPCDISTDPNGRILVSDSGNHRIRLIDQITNSVSTIAGTGEAGLKNGPAKKAQFSWPEGITANDEDVVFVADAGNNQIRKIDNGEVSTTAGRSQAGFENGNALEEALFRAPHAVVIAKDGALYIADTGNHAIRRVFKGRVETLAGTGEPGFADGQLKDAQFEAPIGIAVGEDETIYVADTGNQRIRTIKNGVVKTIAGIPSPGYRDGLAQFAAFSMPTDLVLVKDQIFVADSGNNVIRVIAQGRVRTAAGR